MKALVEWIVPGLITLFGTVYGWRSGYAFGRLRERQAAELERERRAFETEVRLIPLLVRHGVTRGEFERAMGVRPRGVSN